MVEEKSVAIKDMVSEIVSSYVAGNTVATTELPGLIKSVYGALTNLGQDAPIAAPAEDFRVTPAQIRKSIRSDALVSFIDGKPYKTLKRHLNSNGLTFADYKAKFGLPKDYPTTSPDYSAKRSEMALALGLGRKAAAQAPAPVAKAPRRTRAAKSA
jgi:predicted transcriptional regulator